VQRFRAERWLMLLDHRRACPVLFGRAGADLRLAGIVAAQRAGEISTALLLGVPPLLGRCSPARSRPGRPGWSRTGRRSARRWWRRS